MASYNKLTIIGNLGRDPELRYTPQGKAVCTFSVATTSKKKVEQEYVPVTTWFKVTVWDKQAESCAKYLVKGSSVYVEGPLDTEVWKNKDGVEQTSLVVTAREVQFLSGGNKENTQAASASGSSNPLANTVDGNSDTFADDDEIPF